MGQKLFFIFFQKWLFSQFQDFFKSGDSYPRIGEFVELRDFYSGNLGFLKLEDFSVKWFRKWPVENEKPYKMRKNCQIILSHQ